MTTTVIIIIAVTIALVVGPLLWLRPSPRDRQLERLRGRARACGLNVSVREIKDPDPDASARVSSGGKPRNPTLYVALYEMPLRLPGRLEARHVPSWEVVRLRHARQSPIEDEASAHLLSGWRFERPGLPLVEDVIGRLSAQLDRAPRGTIKIEGDSSNLGLYWQERGDEGEVDAIAKLLQGLQELQLEVTRAAARDEALRRQAEDER
ncbi:MAG: hypothetical protein EA417_04270 [Gammaproteobacteria bacterium]|nr:MAG: hypothetical protein EA417_04270 [Gammaproteobacteria bacterium]